MPNFNNIEFLTNEQFDLEKLGHLRPHHPFEEASITILHELGNFLIRDIRSRNFPDVIAFAYWCSRSNLIKMSNRHSTNNYIVGRGIVYHITPGNVPINFAYSLAVGMLTGNINIVKVPSKDFPQVDIVTDCLNKLLSEPEFSEWKNRIFLLRYGHEHEINEHLSQICDVRLIWGGDNAINSIRRSLLKPKSYDLVFADRYSFCVISSSNYLEAQDKIAIANDFYNDVYLFDQNACTSPHLILWVGSSTINDLARQTFWNHLSNVTVGKYKMTPFQSVEKTNAAYMVASISPGALIDVNLDGTVVRVLVSDIPPNIESLRSNSGFFIEYLTSSINDIDSFVTRNFQTMSYYGFDENSLSIFFSRNSLPGIDRVVPIGRTLDFSLIWDGYNLVSALTRQFVVS
jgi:hypothetical protein